MSGHPRIAIPKEESSADKGPKAEVDSDKILRFNRSERLVHWAIAVPFLVCYSTALILFIFYNPNPLRPYREIFSWAHRISGICLIIFPMLAVYASKGDFRIHFYNIRQAWIWTFADIKWLALMGLAAVSKKIQLPSQGKFNAAEKINFMTLMGTYPLYIITGLLIWTTNGAFISWIIHFGMAVIATPLIVGHMFMATINPGSRRGLSGMISGYVDRKWAKHHYGAWYKEQTQQGGTLFEVNHPVQRDIVTGNQKEPLGIEPSDPEEENEVYLIHALVEADTTAPANDPAGHHVEDRYEAPNEPAPPAESAESPRRTANPTYVAPNKVTELVGLYFALGTRYEDTGRYGEAAKHYEALLEIASEYEVTAKEVGQARSKLESLKASARKP